MKKYCLFTLIFMFSFNQIIFADQCAQKSNVDKNVDAKYYCYYNASGLPDDNYNVIVGISENKKTAYADTGRCNDEIGGAGTEPIMNWVFEDSEWDPDLGESFSAKNYFEKNNKCPEIAYLHYSPLEYSLYLINSNQLSSLIDTFSYTAALDNEDKYYLVDFDSNTDVKMTCSYDTNMKENTATNDKNHNVKFDLNFNSEGKIINSNNIATRVSVAPEISSNYKYVNDVCPQLYICYVIGKTYSIQGMSVSEYKYELYFSDYETIYNRNDCTAILCTNTNDSHCDHNSIKGKVCPYYDELYDSMKDDYTADKTNISKVQNYKESKQKLISYCNTLLSNLNADNPCIEKCLNLKSNISVLENTTIDDGECGLSARLITWISNILRWVKYILPVLVIVLAILDFIKAIGSDKEEEMKKAQKRFITRLIAAALVFIVPLILEFVLDKMGFAYDSCSLF